MRTHISQLIHILENEPSKSRCATGKTAREVVAAKNNAKASDNIDDWKEKKVLLRSWISNTLIEENTQVIMGYSSAKEM